MPRPNRERTIASESALARRIAFERSARGMTYTGLAARMASEGCAIQGSALQKIEKAQPPRRIAVDELVALSRVFCLSIDELLADLELDEEVSLADLLREAMEAEGEANAVSEWQSDIERRIKAWLRAHRREVNSYEALLHEEREFRARHSGKDRSMVYRELLGPSTFESPQEIDMDEVE